MCPSSPSLQACSSHSFVRLELSHSEIHLSIPLPMHPLSRGQGASSWAPGTRLHEHKSDQASLKCFQARKAFIQLPSALDARLLFFRAGQVHFCLFGSFSSILQEKKLSSVVGRAVVPSIAAKPCCASMGTFGTSNGFWYHHGTTCPRVTPNPVHGSKLALPSHPQGVPILGSQGSYHLPEPVLVERDHHHGRSDQIATFIEGEVSVLPCHIEEMPDRTQYP